MILGFNVYCDGATSTPYHTTSFPRRGQAAVFSLQVTHLSATTTLDVTVEHRNREDTSWSTAGSFATITSTGVSTVNLGSLKEEIRFALAVPPGVGGDWCRVYIAPPGWRPYS